MNKENKIGFDKGLFILTKLKAEFVYNMAKLEGNTVTYAQAETIVMGKSVANLSVQELRQVDDINKSMSLLIEDLKNNHFGITKRAAIDYNMNTIEKEQTVDYGSFRQQQVAIGGTDYKPPMHLELNALWNDMIDKMSNIEDPLEQSLYLYSEMARNQYFGDGNKRTALLMMNGHLVKNGLCPISISPARETEYRELLIKFYEQPDEYREKFYDFLKEEQRNMLERWGYEYKKESSEIGKTLAVDSTKAHTKSRLKDKSFSR